MTMTELNLSGQNITYARLQEIIKNNPGLTYLDLSWNKLKALPSEIWQLTRLTSLVLSVNQLSDLPSEIGQLKGLTSLDLSLNQLTSVPPGLLQLPRLTIRTDLTIRADFEIR